MTPERWQQIDKLFEAAMEREPGQRTAFLDQACADDHELRREVETLLAAHEQAENFIEAPPADVASELLDDDLVKHKLNDYQILSLLGAGGMGRVYLAQDTRLGRKVALKLLPALFSRDKDRVSRFRREARAILALNHPNILTIYEVGEAEGIHFIATEFIRGASLRQQLSHTKLEISQILEIAIQVASALDAAHAEGIVHRDIKPENVMIGPSGYVKVLDFGLAKLTGQGASSSDGAVAAPTVDKMDTEPGMVMGTVDYMSPEQARGLKVDARSDIWSLGCVIYEMVTGRTPFEGSTWSDVLASILQKDPLPLAKYVPEVSAELDRIVAKALRKVAEERYQEAKELASDLKGLKQRLEFKAEFERAALAQAVSNRATEIVTSSERIAATEEAAATQAGRVAVTRTTSSAEYLVNEIRQHKRGATLAVTMILIGAAALAYYFYFARGEKTTINSLAVLPFTNTGGDPNVEYLSDGISESLINSLSRLPHLKVIARYSSFRYKGKEADPQEVARALGVRAIVNGRVIQRGDQLQVNVELVDTQDKTQMWGEQYNRRAADLQTVQEEIARTISEKLRLRLTGAQEQQLKKRATDNSQAYELYLSGLFHARKGGIQNYKKALEEFNQAIAIDPKFAPAYANVAVIYTNLAANGALDPEEAKPKAAAAIETALELDETLAEAHAAKAIIRGDEWDWSGCENEHRRAVELNPNLAAAHSNYAGYLSRMGRHTEALSEIKRAQELDPLRIDFRSKEGRIVLWARRYDEAVQKLQDVIKLQPDYSPAHENLGYAYDAKGMYAEAIAEYQKVISLGAETTSVQAYFGYALAKSGKRDEALAILDKLKTTKEYVSPAELAILYAGLGSKEEALQSLNRAYDTHDLQMQFVKGEPHYDSLRSDPRFINLMRKIGFTL